MKKTIVTLLFTFLLAGTHFFVLDEAERIAMYFPIPAYPNISDEEAIMRLQTGRFADVYRDVSSIRRESIAGAKFVANLEHHALHVRPIMDKVILSANVLFPVAYAVLFALTIRRFYRWFSGGGGGAILSIFSRFMQSIGFASQLNKIKLKSHENEFLQIERLFKAGLISEDEFLKKKARIKDLISNERLMR
jgi:hypothetical protein